MGTQVVQLLAASLGRIKCKACLRLFADNPDPFLMAYKEYEYQ